MRLLQSYLDSKIDNELEGCYYLCDGVVCVCVCDTVKSKLKSSLLHIKKDLDHFFLISVKIV